MPYDPSDAGVAGPKGAHPIPEYHPLNVEFMGRPYQEFAPRPYVSSEELGWGAARGAGRIGKEVHVKDKPEWVKPYRDIWYEDSLGEMPAYDDSIGRALAAIGLGKSIPSVDQAPPDFGSIEREGQLGATFAEEPTIKLSELQMLVDLMAAAQATRGSMGATFAHERMEPMGFEPMQIDPEHLKPLQLKQMSRKPMQEQRGLSYPNPMRPGASGIREPFMRPSPVTPSPPQSDVLGGVKNQKGKLEALLKLVDDMFPELGEK